MESGLNPANPAAHRLRFEGFVFDLAAGELWRGAERVKLQRQPATVLALLLRRPGEIVSREEIREALWGAETHVDFDQGINWCIRQLRKVLEDSALEPRFIETSARQGYRFIAAVSPAFVDQDAPSRSPRRRMRALPALAAALILMVGLLWHGSPRPSRTLLILPIDNFTGDSAADFLASARTDYLISAVGAVAPNRLHVIDRPTAAKFKKTGECIIKMGQQLHADFVFVGSIERVASGYRLNGGIFRVSDNTQVWTAGASGLSMTDRELVSLPDRLAEAVLSRS